MTEAVGGRLGPWLDDWLAVHGDEMVALRRHLHAHPELSWAESATTELVAERLSVAGLAPRLLSRGTGLLCDIDGDAAGGARSAVALRADLDALPMDDEKDVPYRSQVAGVAHACGHDVHTTVVLGAGLALRALLADPEAPDVGTGPIRLVFQPAEERVPGGALAAIDEGALDGVGAILGVHCEPKLDVGRVGLRAGPITSAADLLEITLSGPGGHTARPELTIDLVRVAADVALRLPAAVQALDGGGRLRLVFGSLQAGQAGNVIPAHARLAGTVRTTDRAQWSGAPDVVARALASVTDGSGAQVDLDYTPGIPPSVNDAAVAEVLGSAARGVLGADAVVAAPQSAGGDDFAWYADRVPACYARLGTHDPSSTGPPLDLHAGHFDVDERCIAVGIRLLVAGAVAACASSSGGP